MISVEFFLTTFAQCNLLLIASYAVFHLSQTIAVKMGSPFGFQPAVRLGQSLILASVLVPVLPAFTPTQNLPRLHFTSVQPLSDGVGVAIRTKAGSHLQAVLPDAIAVRDGQHLNFTSLLEETMPIFLRMVFLLLFGGMAITFLRLIKNLTELRRLIREGVVIRKIGRVVILVSDAIAVPISTGVNFLAVICKSPFDTNCSITAAVIRRGLWRSRFW